MKAPTVLRHFLRGYRTYSLFAFTTLLGIVDFIDPSILTNALGLDAQGKSVVIIGLGIAGVVLRKITTSKAGPILPTKK